MEDIYFEKAYGLLYEEIEKGVCEEFVFTHVLGTVRHLFIKREIPKRLDDRIFYKLVTPYGYGGPRITDGKDDVKEELIEIFQQAFGEYCLKNGIVFESVRFHPIIQNHRDFRNCYELSFRRNTIQTMLEGIDDPVQTEYSASCRRDIRRGLKAGVEYRVIHKPQNLKKFKELYYSTMERNQADAVYYFDDLYFQKCITLLGDYLVIVEVVYDGEVIGMSLSFTYGDFIHVHLTGTRQEFHYLAPAYILQYALALWGKAQGKKLIHHGGGRTGEEDDKLYLFKKKFGRTQELAYFVGRKIWDPAVYEILYERGKLPAAVHDPVN